MPTVVINMAVAILMAVIKNPAKAAQLKEIMLGLRNAINACYPGE